MLRAEEYSGAYYLSGYPVECALKACIAKTVQRHEFPDRERVLRSYSHKLQDLLIVASLLPHLQQEQRDNPRRAASWEVVKTWSEQSRYETWSRSEAEDLLRAIMETKEGVLPWIKRHW